MLKIVTIVGARPQFVKTAALRRAIEQLNSKLPEAKIQEILIHTGQHYDPNLSQVFFDELGIPSAHYHLGVGSASHGIMTGKMLQELEPILQKERPDIVLVYGDTNSTLAGALTAAKLHIPIAHVEAGLRSFNRKMPEEINRILTDHCSNLLFTPTEAASQRLKEEGIDEEKIHQVGDVMYDVSLYYRQEALTKSSILQRIHLSPKGYVLATIHRQENTDDFRKLDQIFRGFIEISFLMPVVMPLHPRTRQVLQKMQLLKEVEKRVQLIDPVGYLDMVRLESEAKVILTDSGGVQKEAFFFHVPCLVLREETEWIELVELGFNHLVPISSKAILESFQRVCQQKPPAWDIKPYGIGDASHKIVACLHGLV